MRRQIFQNQRNETKSFLCTANVSSDGQVTNLLCTVQESGPIVEAPRRCARQSAPFRLERTTNVGYSQEDLPTKIIRDGVVDPCYQQYFFNANRRKAILFHNGGPAESSIAVNPINGDNIVAIWQQDRTEIGAALEVGIAYTFNGGRSWNRTLIPFQKCLGGKYNLISDPWLSFNRDGTLLYLNTSVAFIDPQPDSPGELIVTVISKDGGRTWGPIVPVTTTCFTDNLPNRLTCPFADKPSITADPNIKLNAYVVWNQTDALLKFNEPTYFSKTTDGGKHWSTPIINYDMFPDLCQSGLSTCDPSFYTPCSGFSNDPGEQTLDNVIVVLPKRNSPDSGALLNFMVRFYSLTGSTGDQYCNDGGPLTFFFSQSDIAVVKSFDQGDTWQLNATVVVPHTDFAGNNGAVYIVPNVYTGGYNYDVDGNPDNNNPGNGSLMRSSQYNPMFGVNPENGNLYCVYQTGQFRSDFLPQIGLTTSRDGGNTWSLRVLINRTPQSAPNPQAMSAAVAVTSDGYVGVLYYDFRMDMSPLPNTDPEQQTKLDTWLAIYKEVDGPGDTGIGLDFVQEIRLSKKSFIAQNGPGQLPPSGQGIPSGVMVSGDYSSLVANEEGFYAVTMQTHDGPFTPPQLIATRPSDGATIYVDDNYRQSPYVSVVKRCEQ
jgi:hypothetical protein